MNKMIISAALVALLLAGPSASAFSDIRSIDADYEAIEYVERLGIFEDGEFKPDQVITKGELFVLLLKSDGFDVSLAGEAEFSFEDLSPELEPYFQRMYDLGVFEYDETTIISNQDTKLKKWNALRYFFRYKGIPVQRVLIDSSYLESQIDSIYYKSIFAPYIDRGMKLGLIEPVNRKYDTFAYFTRRDLAKLLYNYALFDASRSENGEIVINVEPTNNVNSSLANEEQFRIFEDVWLRANNDFLYNESIEKDKLLYGAIDGLVEALDDPYTTFQIPTETQSLNDSLSDSYEGIGASLHFEDGKVIIVSPIADSPAEKVGLEPGDIIVGVDGKSVSGMNLDEVIKLIKGEAGTSVRVSVDRNGAIKNFDIVRAEVKVKFVTAEQTIDNILILKINTFGSGASKNIENILSQIDTSKVEGVVIDLRNNPGGYLDEAVKVADFFLPAGETVVEVNYKNRASQTLKTSKGSDLSDLPISIIINKGSASASEILAGALKHHLRADVVGTTSFGKGTVQELVNYSDQSSLKITTAQWLVPSDFGMRSINGVGITPNYVVEITEEDVATGNDAQLNKAILEVRR